MPLWLPWWLVQERLHARGSARFLSWCSGCWCGTSRRCSLVRLLPGSEAADHTPTRESESWWRSLATAGRLSISAAAAAGKVLIVSSGCGDTIVCGFTGLCFVVVRRLLEEALRPFFFFVLEDERCRPPRWVGVAAVALPVGRAACRRCSRKISPRR